MPIWFLVPMPISKRQVMPLLKRLPILLIAALAACALTASAAFASSRQISIVEDNNHLNSDPLQTLEKLKAMGVNMVKYSVDWGYLAPDANSTKAPSPQTLVADYNAQLGQVDAIDRDAQAVGIKLGLEVSGPAPRWAEGTANCSAAQIHNGVCRPASAAYENFVKVLGTRYSGSVAGLPRISWWSVWNEPNYIPNIAPQTVGSSIYAAADIYRGLVNAAWAGLRATGHGSDTLIFGELAPRGIAGNEAGNPEGIKPVQFVASMYCVATNGRRLGGKLARENQCPTNAAAFKRSNPGLFNASGFADHPYAQGVAPNVPTYDCSSATRVCQNARTKRSDGLWTDLGALGHLTSILDASQRAYGSHKRFPIWNTEYGYWSTPNKTTCHGPSEGDCALPAARAAFYDNWAEYLSYRNARIASFDQYQLYEPSSGGWTDGLLSARGAAQATYDAFELPLFLPTTNVGHPANLMVWGGARPATAAHPDVAIQFKGRRGGWKTVKTLRSGFDGFFTTWVHFSASGSVRLAWATGSGATLTSRTQAITVR